MLSSHSIRSIYSQEKEKIIIECVKGLEERFFIEISVNPGHPYLTVKDDFSRARKNVTDLFTEVTGALLLNVEIAVDDRIIRINTSLGSFYFLIRGKFTNLVFQNEDVISFFKHTGEMSLEEFNSSVKNHDYTSAYNFLSIEPELTSADIESLKKKYPIIGKDIIMEVQTRLNEGNKKILPVFNQVILEMMQKRVTVFTNTLTKEVRLLPETFHIFSHNEKKDYDSYFNALNYFIGRKSYYEDFADKGKIISSVINRELHKITGRLEKLKQRLENGSRESDYRKSADLLMMNRHELNKGLQFIEVKDILGSGETIKIKIDPSLSPQKNIDAWFDKAKGEKVNFEKSKQLYQNSEKQFERFISIKKRFENCASIDELKLIMKELKIKDQTPSPEKEDLKSKFKQYIIDKDYFVYVGKDSKNNDLLTTKFAKQNDYWFHARSVSGSHVVLKNESGKSPVPKNILKKTAALAAYHSKAKTAGLVPVSYTFKKYVVKKKGMEPGKVALLKEEVLLVRPEIPEGAEYVSIE